MGGPFASYSFILPKPILLLLSLLHRVSFAVEHLRRRPPPPPPPSQLSVRQPQPPVNSSSVKDGLPVVDFARLAANSPSVACVVCLGGFVASDEVRELGNCRHAFHRECIDRWIDADGLTCPLCRLPLLPSPAAAEEEEKGMIVKMFARVRRINIPLSFDLFTTNLYVDNYL